MCWIKCIYLQEITFKTTTKDLGLYYSLNKLNYVYTIRPGEVSGPITQTHKLDLFHPPVIWQLVNRGSYYTTLNDIFHLLVGFCFRLQSDSFRRLLLGQHYHQRSTPLGCPTSRSAQQHSLGTCSHETGPHLEGWAEERFGPCRCYLLIEATTPVLTLSLSHTKQAWQMTYIQSHT